MKANRRERRNRQRFLTKKHKEPRDMPRLPDLSGAEGGIASTDGVQVSALFQHALALQCAGQLEQACEAYEQVIALAPSGAAAYSNLGHLLLCLHRRQEALAACERAIVLLPDGAEAWVNYGNVLMELGRIEEARKAYERALLCRPGYAKAVSNLGTAMLEEGRLDEAIAAYEKALWLDHEMADARLNRGIVRLLRGEYAEGWVDYEARLRAQRTMTPRPAGETPRWSGEPLCGATILLYAEQGLGDAIQCLRYVPLVEALGGRVLLHVPGSLKLLAQGVSSRARVIGPGDAAPEFAWQCPLMSLPLVFKTDGKTIPAQTPYLTVPLEARRLARTAPWPDCGLRLGLVWAGTPDHPRDWARSISLEMLRPLFGVQGVRFFSLQVGAATAQLQGGNFPVTELDLDVQEMSDAAAKILELDLVIAVDTAMAHLAGALGKPVWLLLPAVPDWRWLFEREDSPWYPTMRLFRQQRRGEWEPVIERVRLELVDWAKRSVHSSADDRGVDLRSDSMQRWLRGAVPAGLAACKICKAPSALFGVVDFHKSCVEAQGKRLALAGIPIYYRRCERCGFLFTEAFDAWTESEFAERIYNSEYALVDPDYEKARPTNNAHLIAEAFGGAREQITVLDYGGGSGRMVELLRAQGFAAVSYDPFSKDKEKPEGRFDLITCFEVLEHAPWPLDAIAQIHALLKEDGLILFSTLLQPATIAETGLSWWYAGPRNGHCSLYSAESLMRLFGSVGMQVASSSEVLHLAYRSVPSFAAHLRIGR